MAKSKFNFLEKALLVTGVALSIGPAADIIYHLVKPDAADHFYDTYLSLVVVAGTITAWTGIISSVRRHSKKYLNNDVNCSKTQ